MNPEFGTLFGLGIAYLCLLFAIAWLTDRNIIPSSLASHPIVYTLSIGVFACGWSFFGMISVAQVHGVGYLGFFVGTGALFLFAPLLLLPLLRLCRRMQFTSLADLLAYRYRGARVGAIATLGMLLAALPLIAAQIRIVSEIAALLGGSTAADPSHARVGLVFAVAVAVFAILFGARPISDRERHNGLVVTMAFETLVKLCAVLAIGLLALRVFDGPQGMSEWLLARPDARAALHDTLRSGSGHLLTLGFLAAAIGLPHLFHMAVYENPSMRAVMRASWAFPLLLLLLSLPVLPVLWAGMRLNVPGPVEFYGAGIAIAAGSPAVAFAAFLAAVSAASSTIIVLTLAVSSMISNNFVLPFYRLGGKRDLYRGVLLVRSVLIALVILAAWSFSVTLAEPASLRALGFTAFIAAAQFFPGTVALLYWPAANRAGFLGGIAAGYSVWMLALLTRNGSIVAEKISILLPFHGSGNPWADASVNSLALNALVLVAVSWLTRQSAEEREAAATCSLDNLSGRGRQQLQLRSPAEFTAGLSRALGRESADREVVRALSDLGYASEENRPYAMRRLRDRIEANLSRLMGASVAIELVDTHLPYTRTPQPPSADDIHFVESRLEGYQRHLTGFAAELDGLRRFYRNTLQELPVGVCGVNTSNEIVMWNHAIERITGVGSGEVLGTALGNLAPPWGPLIAGFIASGQPHVHQHHLVAPSGQAAWISLHQTPVDTQPGGVPDARFVLIEDVTENLRLQQELFHSERLASIGRLAAGVAHEIGNPVTGIDCLAQNLLAEYDDGTVHESAQHILRQTHRIGNILNTLVNFAHSGSGTKTDPERLTITQCVDEAIYLLGLDRGARFVRFRNLCDPRVSVDADGQKLLQVFVNLLSNARDASRHGGEIRIESRLNGNHSLTTVTDDGTGIAAEHLDKIFDPFFTTKAPGDGTGLGLALVYTIVRDMHGETDIASPCDTATGRGTRVTIRLPVPSSLANDAVAR
jgi:PAS domain S-box-containing protein